MHKKLLLTILISVFFYTIGFAQTQPNTDTNDKLEFSTGYNSGVLKNLEFAPVSRYNYTGLVHNLGYERINKNHNLFNIELNFLTAKAESDRIPTLDFDYTSWRTFFVSKTNLSKK